MTWRSRPSAGARSGILRASSLLLAATAMLAAFMAAPSAAVAAPAPTGDAAVAAIGAERASASSAGTLSVTTSTAAASPAKGGGFSVMSGSCPYAGQYVDPWLIVFQGCTLTGQPTTAVSARCSNGATLGPVHVPPGVYDIYVDCYPAFFSSLAFI